MAILGETIKRGYIAATIVAATLAIAGTATFANAENVYNPFEPIELDPGALDAKSSTYQFASQSSGVNAVDGLNLTYGFVGGTLDGVANGMGLISVSTAIPYIPSFAVQGDLAFGYYDGTSADKSAAAALHIFWRDPGVGMLGIYGDWGYLSPIHSGRLGVETAYYSGQWSFDGLFAMEFGQNVYTKFVDEIDVSYYYNENTRISVGHRITSRGNVGNIGFEKQFGEMAGSQWSVFGEAEAGEDDFYQVFVGIKASIGTGAANSLIDRDRNNTVKIRIPRNLASITQCAGVDEPFPAPNWLTDIHLIKPGSMTETLCASESELNAVSSKGIFNP